MFFIIFRSQIRNKKKLNVLKKLLLFNLVNGHNMCDNISFAVRSVTTVGATEGFLSSMNHHMTAKIGRICEGFPTEFTGHSSQLLWNMFLLFAYGRHQPVGVYTLQSSFQLLQSSHGILISLVMKNVYHEEN